MRGEAIRGFLQIGVFVGAGGWLLALMLPPDSPEFVVSVCSGIIGTILIVAAIVLARVMRSW